MISILRQFQITYLSFILPIAATQKRIGESKVIAARAEVDAAKLMRER